MRALRKWPSIARFWPRSHACPCARALWLACVVALASCAGSRDLPLLEVHDLEIDDDRGLLYVLGAGFVSDAHCALALDGTEYPRGRTAQRVSLEVPCRVLTDARAVTNLAEPALSARRRGWFEGRLTLRLASASDARTVSGTREAVRLRVGAHGSSEVDDTLAEARAATRFQRSMGVRSVETGARGVLVTTLDEEGPFARSGGRVGDLIRRINGAPVEEASDLIAASSSAQARLDILRRGTGVLGLSVTLGQAARLPPTLWLVPLLLACVLGALLPAAGRRHQAGRAERLRGFVLSGLLVWLSSVLFSAVDAGLLWFVAFAAHAAHAWLRYTRGQSSSVALARELTFVAAPTLCIAALALSVGTLRAPLPGLEEAQDATLTLACASLPGLLAVLGLWLAVAGHASARDEPTVHFVRGAAAWTVAALGLGAGAWPSLLDQGAFPWALVSPFLFALEAACVLTLLVQLGAVRRTLARTLAILLSCASVALTWLEPLAAHLPPAELVLAVGVGLGLGRMARTLWANRELARLPARDPALHPFL